jgi:hypothetical protein
MSMPTDLLTEFTHEAADSSRRNARHVKSFAADLGEKSVGIDRRTAELFVREAVGSAIRFGRDAIPKWEAAIEFIKLEARSSSARLAIAATIEAFDSWLILEAETRQLLEIAARKGIAINEQAVHEFDATSRGVTAARTQAAAILAAFNQPWPEIDAARLAQGRKEVAEGRTMKSDEVIAAIRAARK